MRSSLLFIAAALLLPLYLLNAQEKPLSGPSELFVRVVNSGGSAVQFRAHSEYDFMWENPGNDYSYITKSQHPEYFDSYIPITGDGTAYWDFSGDYPSAKQIRCGLYTISAEGKSAWFAIEYRSCYGTSGPGDVWVTYDYASDRFSYNGQDITGRTIYPPHYTGDHTCLPVPVTVQNSFGGGVVSVAGFTHSSPWVENFYVGVGKTIAAISPQTIDGTTYTYTGWSDGGAQSHNVSISLEQGATTYTAYFAHFSVSISGPTWLSPGQMGTWTANPTGGTPPLCMV